ncbi:uncharacterized protein PAC_10965 [Phialocephala subalpina]|uniref:Uncharacterized protein n=1 Tax=Phialocephala subalpina TaxID=576137 RepID=A0A1L7X7R9_9HELO|nr:uncharacterized protein PAC_10965 [Phialocephala subalpina]
MKTTVPSLIASSTVGIAAAGLVLGKPDHSPPQRPSSKKRKVGDLVADVVVHNRGTSAPPSRPATAVITLDSSHHHQPPTDSSPIPPPTLQHRASSTRVEIPNHSSRRRLSIFRHEESSSPREHIEEEHRRESVSSRGSWIRRLSTIPNSHNNSPRSSIVGPESPSLAYLHGSAVPILSNPGSSPAQLPPNKLVKRATSGRTASGPAASGGSKSQVLTLRRPATSHQRSVTLQQQFRDDSMVTTLPVHQTPTTTRVHATPSSKVNTPESRHAWRVYFEARPTKLSKERTSGKSSDGGIHNILSTSRRVIPDEAMKPTLMKPEMITRSKLDSTLYYDDSFEIGDDELEDVDEKTVPTTELGVEEPHKRVRRSVSINFGSPSSWISRSGSLRGKKRNAEDRSGGVRHSSAPISTMPSRGITTSHGSASHRPRTIMDPKLFQQQPLSPTEDPSPSDPFSTNFISRSRNSSSPLPPLSRLSSFNLDIARLGLSSSSSSAPRRSPTSPMPPHTNTTSTSLSSTGHPSPASTTYFGSVHQKNPRTSEVADRASTLVESDNDTRGFISGDEDDTDFQSETVFDSLRSGATGSIRSHNPPLESMFDESPPSLNGHAKSKRLSIHEMLASGGFQEASNRIVEEDEGMSTPVKPAGSSQEDTFQTPVRRTTIESDEGFPSSPPSFCLATKEFGRLSLDDDEEDEDWTKDDENMEISNSLSPPNSSLNSRKVSPSFRAALADVTHSGSTNGNPAAPSERPKSNLFDWSEPSSAEKIDLMGNSPRPKTAHVKHLADGRGGRTIGRKGPSALHIRSQSVPVVPDVAGQRDHSKLTPKFGTWGLGAKGVSEDWDGDFEFDNDEDDNGATSDTKMENSGMLVPLAIQASQASVVGHVGQIREFCLLVEDLKRLRSQGKERKLLNGPYAAHWKEAEGVIALAASDEEDPTLSPPHSPASIVHDQEMSEDKFLERGPDVEDVSMPDAPIEVLNRHGKPTGFIYDGNTVRRRSVFSPEDDIFGAGIISNPPARDYLRPPSKSPRHSIARSASDTARSVMETMHQHRSTSDPLLQNLASQSPDKMPFDTTSLKDLVNKASQLSRTLAEVIRKHDGSQSPENSPNRDSSPAFTRVFTDPSVSPPKHLLRSHSNNSILGGSIDASPTRSIGQRMHMMTVV